MREKILGYVRTNNHVSFVELQREIGADASGEMVLCSGKDRNVYFWDGLSEELIKTLRTLMDEKLIEMRPANILTYMVDGQRLNLPTVRKVPTKGYKTPHWAPVCFCTPNAPR